MRIDKFLKESRIIKRRTIAAKACDNGRVKINEQIAKAGQKVSVGDIVEIEFGPGITKIKVVKLLQSPKKQEATLMYENMESSR